MRVVAEPRHLEVEPGQTAAVDVDVINTDAVIDGITAHIIGFPEQCVRSSPAMLPLFPDAAGRVSLDLAVPRTHPAGRHPLTVQVVSHASGAPPDFVDVDLDVASRPGLRVEARPRLIRARRKARFVLEVTNSGNVTLDVALEARDPDRAVRTVFTPPRRRVAPGTVAPVMLAVRGPRMITGADVDRTVVVTATAEPVDALYRPVPDVDADAAAGEAAPDPVTLVREVSVQLRQRPIIGRGLMTILILLAIIATWAAIFLFGLAKVFAQDPMTKEAPASFFASLNSPTGTSSPGAVLQRAGNVRDTGAAPAGAVSKSGQLPAGMGGSINGVVTSANDGQPVGRILVQAYRVGRNGLEQMSSAASQADGTYSLAGLFPTRYYLKFSAAGYRTQWYRNRTTARAATPVTAAAQASASNIDAAVVGLPATISGKVDPGNTLKKVRTQVVARALRGSRTGMVIGRATTNGSGAYTVRNLPAPGSYQLTFTTKGYESSTLVDSVVGGDRRLEPTVPISAAGGQISGVVTAGGVPLGNATVRTIVGGRSVQISTPTTGQVGAYVLGNLPTPGTYVVTVSKPGSGSSTKIVDLAAGQSRTGLDLSLSTGSGSIAGRVVSTQGRGLGGATVTVGGTTSGGGSLPTVTTLTAGDPGAFTIDGLRAPGSYTLTVSLAGYAPASVPVRLSGAAPAHVTVRLPTRRGSVAGVVTGPDGRPVTGAVVTAANGRDSRTTTDNSSDGRYVLAGLAPGSYSVTVTAAGHPQRTALVTVTAGRTTSQDLRLVS